MGINEYFQDVLEARNKSGIFSEIDPFGYDLFILSRNYEETVEFLSSAQKELIGIAVEVVSELVEKFPKEQSQTIINVLKKRIEEFPDLEDYSLVEIALEMKIAQEIVDDM